MGGIPGIGTGARSRASSSFWQTSDVAIPAYAVSAGQDSINGTLRNNLRGSISSVQATIGGASMTEGQNSLSAGQETTFTGSITCANAGDAYSLDVSITYTDDDTGAAYTYTGEGHKLEGKCAS